MSDSKTDIDRLHAVVDGQVPYRRAGRTTAACHEVASVIELGETEVAVILPFWHWRRHVVFLLTQVLLERGVGHLQQVTNSELYVGNTRITILSAASRDSLAGRRGVAVEVTG